MSSPYIFTQLLYSVHNLDYQHIKNPFVDLKTNCFSMKNFYLLKGIVKVFDVYRVLILANVVGRHVTT